MVVSAENDSRGRLAWTLTPEDEEEDRFIRMLCGSLRKGMPQREIVQLTREQEDWLRATLEELDHERETEEPT